MFQESSNSQPKENLTYSYPEGILVINKEPRTFIKGFFNRKNKNSVLIRFKRGQRKCSIASEVKSCWPGTKPTETNKNVCMKQVNFMTSSCSKSCGKNIVCSVKIMNLPEYILPTGESDWNKQHFGIR